MGLFARVMHDAFGGASATGSKCRLLVRSVHVPWRHCRHRPDQYQTPDGLFLHRAYGLCADGLGGGHALGVQAMLVYMAIYVTMNVGTFAFILMMERTAALSPIFRAEHVFQSANPAKRWRCWSCCSPGWRAADAGLLSASSTCCAPPMTRVWLAGCGRCDRLGDRRVLLPAHRVLHVLSVRTMGAGQRDRNTLWVFLMASALIMVLGSINLFGIEPWRSGALPCQLKPLRWPRRMCPDVWPEVMQNVLDVDAPWLKRRVSRQAIRSDWILALNRRPPADDAGGHGRTRRQFSATLVLPCATTGNAALRRFVAALALYRLPLWR